MLTVSPCLARCDWSPTTSSYDGEPLFACRGCGSQWVRSQPWSPRQSDGSWPAGIQEELVQRGRQRG